MVHAKKSAKDWNSFTLTKKLERAEQEELELMRKESEAAKAEQEEKEDASEKHRSHIFVHFGPQAGLTELQQRADLGMKWQMQLRSGGVEVAGTLGREDSAALVFTARGMDDTKDALQFLMEQPEVLKCVLRGNEYWNTGRYPEEFAQAQELARQRQQQQQRQQEEEEEEKARAEL